MITVKRGIEHRIQMPERYESVVVSAEVTVELDNDQELETIAAKVQEALDTVIKTDLDEAEAQADGQSYVHEWRE